MNAIDIIAGLTVFSANPSLHSKLMSYLMNKGISQQIAKKYLSGAIRYSKYISDEADEGKDAASFLSQYTNPNTYNNLLKAIIHLHRFLSLPEPNLKFKNICKDRLIIAPSYDDVLQAYKIIKDIGDAELIRFYLLCSTTLLRPQFIVTLVWANIDLDNRIINVKVDRKTKHYRPQIIHRAILPYLICHDNCKVFTHRYDYYQKKIKAKTDMNPSQLRDFAYNAMLKAGMNPLLVEWLMGHNIGIAAHYLADNIKEEYAKFESLYTFVT
ncbi:MAG: hypothetical protein NZ888_06375 [Candidatus Nitrosocaldus sp.]|nr:hypothetical protein [Candidatus Nitrosocaldus sp.]MCS7141793.1 hypothetical protein [Candidatus Nitrosocaldus sp.]MDW8000469.1 hypothetical protein [Candidatus Nitrosocaldus sp.]